MHFIEHYPDGQDQVAEIGGRTIPIPALVEDDDGIRLFLTYSTDEADVVVPVHAWTQAHTAGAAALVDTRSHRWMLAETFMEGRTEHHASASYRAPHAWSGPEADLPLSYRDMMFAVDEAAKDAGFEPSTRFVNLHAHSEYSALDGMSKVEEMVAAAVADGQPAVAVADHGTCAAHPILQKEAEKAGIRPIFGIEANFVHDRLLRGDPEVKDGADPRSARYILGDYYHLVLWALDDQGLRNLWAMNTEANATGFYGRPRMDWDVLERWSEGVALGTSCLRGPLSALLLAGEEEQARTLLARFMAIFPGRLYVEIQTNQLPEQQRLNQMLVALADEYDLPLVATCDSHYPTKADAEHHQVWIAAQTNKDLLDDADLFAGRQDYHMLTEAEVRQALAYLGPDVVERAIENTSLLAERCTATVAGKATPPIYSKVGANGDTSEAARRQRDVERLVDLCLSNWDRKVTGKPLPVEQYEERFEREMRLLIDKQFPGYFLMVADYCAAAKDGRVMQAYNGKKEPIIVGPGRGSGGGSLVGYLADITELDPVDGDLLFERFLTEGRTELPDFDVDFPESKRDALMAYLEGKYGEDHILRVGTHVRLQNKGVVKDMFRVLASSVEGINWLDQDAIAKIIDAAESDKAGLGMPWEDLWNEHEEVLAPFRAKYPTIFHHADRLVGRLKSYGKHPAGVIISTGEALTDRLPMRRAGDQMVAEFDLKSLESLGYVKFDLLTLRTLDTIQEAIDQVRATYGIEVNPYVWRDEYEDPQVWGEISDGHTLGIFQIETRAGTKLTKRFRPESLNQLSDVITLVRPGPVRSGLTETYFRRRQGLEEVTFPDPRLETVLAKTYGTMLYQEDIMAVCMTLAGYSSTEADVVRKILGKKQVEKVAEAGAKFVTAAVERGMPREGAEHLWEQMAEFAKYSFNRAHAYGYAVLGYWTAWLKFHYPAQYLNALLSTVDKNRIPEFVNEARRMGYKVLPPDINLSGVGFSAHGVEIRYGLDKVKGVAEAAVQAIVPGQPYASFEDFMARKGPKANSGIVKTLAAVGAFDSLEPHRKALEARLAFEAEESGRCVFKDESALGPGGLPCTFDWAHEKDPPLKAVGRGKDRQMLPVPPPKRCTKACRNFTAPTFSADAILPYTDAEIRDKEMALLGIHLSSTPFDVIPQDILEDECFTADEIEAGPEGEYLVAAVVQRVKPHVARTGKQMAFLTLLAQTAEIDVTVFSDQWERFRDVLKPSALMFAYVRKNDRGMNLVDLVPLSDVVPS